MTNRHDGIGAQADHPNIAPKWRSLFLQGNPVACARDPAGLNPDGRYTGASMTLPLDSSDAAVISAMAEGLDALDVLYLRYRILALSVAHRITGEATLAEDVVQEAFISAWRNASRYDPAKGSVKRWLMVITEVRAIDAVRRRKPTIELPEFDGPLTPHLHSPDVWVEVSAGLDAENVRRAIGTLTDAQRVAIELAYFGGLTQAQIARETGTPLGTVKSRMRHGLLTMRREITVE